MKLRGALGLVFLLLLSLVAESAAHDHDAGHDQAARACLVDHESGHAEGPRGSTPRLLAAGELHEHHCLGCRASGQRFVLGPAQATRCPGLIAQAPPLPDDTFPVSQPWRGQSTRGPPLA